MARKRSTLVNNEVYPLSDADWNILLRAGDDLCPHGVPYEFCGNCHEEDETDSE